MSRIKEYYKTQNVVKHKTSVSTCVDNLYKQERDWTCSLACIRTMLSSKGYTVKTENYYIDKYKMKPGPYFSKDIKKLGILKEYDVKYGSDSKNTTFDMMLKYMEEGYAIMLESMYNCSHWMVLLAYYRVSSNLEANLISCFDPYYNNVRIFNADEFISMWIDGDYVKTKVKQDFIAIK